MLKTFVMILSALFKALTLPIAIVIITIAIFSAICFIFFIYYYRKGYRLKKGSRKKIKKTSVFKRIFYEAPKRIILDLFNKEPDFFRPQGLIIFTGFQGKGKTSALVKYTLELQKEYPKSKVISNLGYAKTDEELKTWRQLTDFRNGIYGVIVQMDELQNWFSSKQSKNFPPEMLSVVTQNRKNRRVILGTAQNFYMIAKDIRTQCTELRKCETICGCITIVHRVRPVCNEQGEVEKLKHLGFYFFVHDDELRNSYDTYKIIENLSKSDFKPRENRNIE